MTRELPKSWENVRQIFSKKKQQRPIPTVCVCSHSKYHHDIRAGEFLECFNRKECGCEKYEEWKHIDPEIATEIQDNRYMG